MSIGIAIEALKKELKAIEIEEQELLYEKAKIARALSTLTGRDEGEGRVSVKLSSYPKGGENRPGVDSIPGKVLAYIEANGPVTMGQIMRDYFGTAPEKGTREWNRIGIYPGTLVKKGWVFKTEDGRYKAASANGSAPAIEQPVPIDNALVEA